MSDDDKKVVPIRIPLSEILDDLENFQDKMEELRKGNNPFEQREEKSRGGSVGSLIEKDLRQPEEPEFRMMLASSGMTRDQEIGMHLFILDSATGPGSISGDHLLAVEESEKWLEENLTPAEKRQLGR